MNIFSVIIKIILGLFKSAPAASVPSTGTGTKCIATCFGYNDPGDNGIGAWGAKTNNKTLVGVSLPIPVVRETFGSTGEEVVKQHSVTVQIGDRVVSKMPIVDLGPGEKGGLIWDKKANVGHILDLTYGACEALGVKYDANSSSFSAEFWIVDASGKNVAIKGLEGTKYYV